MPDGFVSSHAHLITYLVLLIGIVALPGMDMAFVLGKSLVGGARAGTAALAGIVTGGVAHNVIASLGVGLVVQAHPKVFGAMLSIGAAYMAWIGWTILRHAGPMTTVKAAAASSHAATFGQGLATCLMNPKAYLFMLAVFPQFVRPEYGPIAAQALVIAAMTACVQAIVYGLVAWAGMRARGWLGTSGRAQVMLARAVGVMLLAAAAWSLASAWRG